MTSEKYTVELLQPTEAEIREACAWYEEQQPGLAQKLLAEINNYLEQIAKDPLRFVVRYRSVYRIAILKIFPYLIVFKVVENDRKIFVYSVFHTSRRPAKYKK